MAFNDISILISLLAIFIAVGGFLFNWKLDQRKLTVKLKSDELTHFDDKNPFHEYITIFAYNNGQRPVTITNYNFKLNGTLLNETKSNSKNEKNNLNLKNNIKADFELIHVIKQGGTCFFKIKSSKLFQYLINNKYNGKVKVSGFYEGADGEIYESELFYLDTDNKQVKICKSWRRTLKNSFARFQSALKNFP